MFFPLESDLWIKITLLLFFSHLIAMCFRNLRPSRTVKKAPDIRRNANVKALADHVSANTILTASEQEMYILLAQACPPENIVLCQVSFNAFLKCSDLSTRNKFNRSMCDFMITTKSFDPIVCIELDDRSHKYTVEKDKFRDDLLAAANIPTERFIGMPKDLRAVKKRLKPHLYS